MIGPLTKLELWAICMTAMYLGGMVFPDYSLVALLGGAMFAVVMAVALIIIVIRIKNGDGGGYQ